MVLTFDADELSDVFGVQLPHAGPLTQIECSHLDASAKSVCPEGLRVLLAHNAVHNGDELQGILNLKS